MIITYPHLPALVHALCLTIPQILSFFFLLLEIVFLVFPFLLDVLLVLLLSLLYQKNSYRFPHQILLLHPMLKMHRHQGAKCS